MSKDNKLQQKILKEVYSFERKRTKFWIIKYLLITFLTLTGLLLVLITTLEVLNKQRTLDVLEIFQQDFDIINSYWQDALSTIIEETPVDSEIELLFLVIVLIILIILLAKNFRKIRNRLSAIKKNKS